jgi:hypothetical protein
MYLSASLFDLDDPREVPDVGLELQKLVPHFHRILGGEASRRQNSLKQNPGITWIFYSRETSQHNNTENTDAAFRF